MFDIIGEALWYTRIEGWPFVLRKGLKRFLSFFFELRTYAVFYRAADESLDIKPRMDVETRLATLDDLGEFGGMVGPKRLKLFEARLKADRTCFLALHEGKIVGFLWATIELDPYLEPIPFDLFLEPHDVYLYDMFVLPECRRMEVMYATIPLRKRIYEELGVRRRVWWVHVDNIVSFTRVSRLPESERQIIRSLQLLWFRKTWRIEKSPNSAVSPDAKR